MITPNSVPKYYGTFRRADVQGQPVQVAAQDNATQKAIAVLQPNVRYTLTITGLPEFISRNIHVDMLTSRRMFTTTSCEPLYRCTKVRSRRSTQAR